MHGPWDAQLLKGTLCVKVLARTVAFQSCAAALHAASTWSSIVPLVLTAGSLKVNSWRLPGYSV